MKKKAFTLAEIIVVLTLLGVVVAITIPNTINNATKKQNVLKVKKALPVFERAIEQMRIANNITNIDELEKYANEGGACENIRKEFKIKKYSDEENASKCIFQTNDGVWWNMSNIKKPIISPLKDGYKYLTTTYADKSLTDEEGTNAFYLTLMQGDGSLGYAFLMNDLNHEADANKCDIKKTLAYAKIIDENELCSDNESQEPVTDSARCGGNSRIACKEIRTLYNCKDLNGTGCTQGTNSTTYDECGNVITYNDSAQQKVYTYDSNNKCKITFIDTYYGYIRYNYIDAHTAKICEYDDRTGDVPTMCYEHKFDDLWRLTSVRGYNDDGTLSNTITINEYDDYGNTVYWGVNCSSYDKKSCGDVWSDQTYDYTSSPGYLIVKNNKDDSITSISKIDENKNIQIKGSRCQGNTIETCKTFDFYSYELK